MAYRTRKSTRRRTVARGRVSRRYTARRPVRATRRRSASRRSSGHRELRIVVQAAPEATAMATAGSIRVAARKSSSTF